ncbi:sigma-70 family RNA polymerase sigma factor [Duganella sp. FT80W]|uniref:Sigma-70 family RNA polymerase sigma factor n=1 Tax=Duganella guangzhouensis TaxID=2666084 RepID=A0A6I2L8J3_9BURK|nr:sigma-70 family RNA polymerase sigma factor [Duganella guangzhouensis]MRW94183.1 sigma-70 family RNA polymerase sigma factor [Duganella guangzhouensis]
MHVDTGETAALWEEFARSRAAALRERLASHYLPFARMLAAKMYANRTHLQVEFDEYLQYARVGLLEAVDRFDSTRGFKFETYAASRINGAILNGMASYSEVHEQIAARKRLIEERMASLKEPERTTQRPDDLFGYLAELAIGLAVGFALDDTGMYQEPEQSVSYRDYTYASVELAQLRARLKALLDTLPARHAQVIRGHYLQQLPFEQLAEMLALSRGRISQIHKEALLKLREGLRATPELNWSG